MKRRFIATFVCIVFLSLSGSAQSDEKITERFFSTYKSDPLKAYSDLFEGNRWADRTDIETVQIKLKGLLKDLGAYYGYEAITTKKAGESYILKSYLVRYERQPLRFTFILYKPNDKWQFQNITYDTNLSEELEAAAKIDRLKENW